MTRDFVRAVKQSKLLSAAQKREFLDRPELLPEEYRKKLVAILTEFDIHARARAKRVKKYISTP